MSTGADTRVPREPSAYRPSIHFGQQASDAGTDRKRHLSGDIINGCIQDGSVRKINREIRWFTETFDGVTYRLVVDVHDREVVTGYPIQVDRDTAATSARWSCDELEDIEHFIETDPRSD